MDIQESASQCKKAAISISAISSEIKDRALQNIIKNLEESADLIIQENENDLKKAKRDNLEAPLIKRLKFDHAKISESIDGIASLIKLDDPVGKTLKATELDKGLTLFKVSRPIGVIGVILNPAPMPWCRLQLFA